MGLASQQIILGAIAQGLLWSIMAIGVYITYRILDTPDLSAEGCFTLGASVFASLVTREFASNLVFLNNPYVATFVAVLAGVLAGVVTGLLHTKLKIPALLSGILTMTALYSINLKIMGKSRIAILDGNREQISVFKTIENIKLNNTDLINKFPAFFYEDHFSKDFSVILSGIIILFFVVLLLWLFFNTEIGYMLRATGNNQNMVRALGTNTDTMKILGLGLGNGIIAFSSSLIGQFNNYSDVGMGIGTIVIGLSSVIIGEALFLSVFHYIFKRHAIIFNLISIIFGSILYRLIITYAINYGDPNDLKLYTAVILALALVFPQISGAFKKYNGGHKNVKSL